MTKQSTCCFLIILKLVLSKNHPETFCESLNFRANPLKSIWKQCSFFNKLYLMHTAHTNRHQLVFVLIHINKKKVDIGVSMQVCIYLSYEQERPLPKLECPVQKLTVISHCLFFFLLAAQPGIKPGPQQ